MPWDSRFDVRVHSDMSDRGLVRVVLWETIADHRARWGGAGPMPAPRVVSGFEEEEAPDGAYVEPSFTMTDETAQQVMDRLFDLGFRPTGAAGTAGQLSAVQSHLMDMRVLVAKALDVSLP